MIKFLVFDPVYGRSRLPLAYSIGDIETLRSIFSSRSTEPCVAVPILPPQRDIINDENTKGYLVYPPAQFSSKFGDFLEHTVVHIRELKGKGYDFRHPLFKNYLASRADTISYLTDRLESVINQERRLGLFNLFWLTMTKKTISCIHEIVIKSSGNLGLKFNLYPHTKNMLIDVQKSILQKCKYKDSLIMKNFPSHQGILKSKLGDTFNFHFVNDMLNVQLSLLESSVSPLDPLFLIKKILVQENIDYFISFKDFKVFYETVRQWLETKIAEGDEWLLNLLSYQLCVSQESISKINIHNIIFDPKIIYTLQDTLKQIQLHPKNRSTIPGRRKTLVDEIDPKIWKQMILDFVKLAQEIQKAEIISFFRDRIILLEQNLQQKVDNATTTPILEDRITYNFNTDPIINDLRKVTILFIDLRGFTEASSGVISSGQLKTALYNFFDPTLDVIQYFSGQIRFFAGDAILAIFSDHCPENERTINAVRVGIKIQRLLKFLVKKTRLPFEGAGIGIHFGPVESAYIFKNENEKFDTVIGLSANVTSRLSSGKSTMSERRGDPTFKREINDLFQDVIEKIKGKVTPTIQNEIVRIFEQRLLRLDGEHPSGKAYLNLPELKDHPGNFNVTVTGGVLHNNGVVLSEEAFKELNKYYTLEPRSNENCQEFLLRDDTLKETILFRPTGDAFLKGLKITIPVWSAQPEKI